MEGRGADLLLGEERRGTRGGGGSLLAGGVTLGRRGLGG